MNLEEIEESILQLNRRTENAARGIFREYYRRQSELTEQFKAKCGAARSKPAGGKRYRRLAYYLICVNELLTKHFLTPLIAFSRSEVTCASYRQLGEILDRIQQSYLYSMPKLDFSRFYDLANALHQQRQLVQVEFSKALTTGQKELELLALTKQASARKFDARQLISAVCTGSSNLLHPLIGLEQQRIYYILLRHSVCSTSGCNQSVLQEPAARRCTQLLEERLMQLNENAAKGKQKQRLVNLIASGAKSMGIDEFLTSFMDYCSAADCLEQYCTFLYFTAPYLQQETSLLVAACLQREKELAARIDGLMKEQAVEEVITVSMDYLQFRRVFELFKSQNCTIRQFREEATALEQYTKQCGDAIFYTIALVAGSLVGRMKIFYQCYSQPEWVFYMWQAQTEIMQQRECVEWLLDYCRSASAERICAEQKQRNSELSEEAAFFRILAGSVYPKIAPRNYEYTPVKSAENLELRAALQKYEYLLTNLKAEAYQLCYQFSAHCEGVSFGMKSLADEYHRRLYVFVEAYRNQVAAQYQHVFGGYIDEYNRAAAERNALRAEELEYTFRRLWRQFKSADSYDGVAENANGSQRAILQQEKYILGDELDRQQQEAFQRCKQLISDYKRQFDQTKRYLQTLPFQELITASAAAQTPQIAMALCAGAETMEASRHEGEQEGSEDRKIEAAIEMKSQEKQLVSSKAPARRSRKPQGYFPAYASARAATRRSSGIAVDRHQEKTQEKIYKNVAKTKFRLTRMLRNGSIAADLELMADRIALFYQGKYPQQLLYANVRSVSASDNEVRIHLQSSQVAVFSGEQSAALAKALTLCLKY